jgi:hypothetical protein
MTYRDDRDADRARIEALEHELAQAKAKVNELEGKRSQALVLTSAGGLTPTGKATSASAKWAGAPFRLELAHTWDKEYPLEKLEDLLDPIREVTRDNGRVEMLRTSMTWTSSSPEKGAGPFITLRISVKNGVTRLEAGDRLGQLAGVIFGAIGGGLGGGAVALPIFASVAVPVLAPVIALGWVGGFYGGLRQLFKSRARKRAEKLQQVFDRVRAEIDAQLSG